MDRTLVLLLACTAVEGYIGTNVFVELKLNWDEAQEYCREFHTDLSFVETQFDAEFLLKASITGNSSGWLGLQKDPYANSAWMWSGGGHMTFSNWADRQPDNNKGIEDKAHVLPDGKWNDASYIHQISFYCIQVIVPVEKMSWEKALEYCREHHIDFSSVISETENLVALSEVQTQGVDRVWIGLRYLVDRWLWVDGHPLEYEAWTIGGGPDQECPIWKRCGALTNEGLWESWDCQQELNFICY